MPIQEPQSPLWAAVKPQVAGALGGSGWIDTDEEAVRALATQWTNAGAVFGSAMSGNQRPPGFVGPVANEGDAWPDDAGITWTTRRLGLGADLAKQGTEMRTLAAHATAFADDVIHTKEQIVQTIQANAAGFDELAALPDGAGAAAMETFAAEVARAIVAFVGEMTAIVAGRRPGVASQAERPKVDIDPDDLDGFGMAEAADWAGAVSAVASTAALAAAPFPPVALALGAVALATGAFAFFQHTREAVADPTPGNIVTAGGDALSLIPGVGALGKGANAFADAVSSTAPGWTHVATGLGANAPEVATGLQAGTQVLPQVPTVIDLTTPGSQSELQGASDLGTAGYTAGRGVDIVGALR
ncbi:hypothetical protein [Actinophytocola sp. NPDC049390]|uniref:WXG100-like domain-containing protein n=1 Tax=Actinophytocola sp. NPDC049390 TaxID=3363894 RepID=UPI00379E75F9